MTAARLGEIELRTATAADLDYLSDLAHNPLVAPYLMPTAGDIDRLAGVLAQTEADGPPSGLFVIQTTSGDALGGLALLTYSRRSRVSDLMTLMVRPHSRRSGVATVAVRLACRHALLEHGFHRVQAETYGDNAAGQRVFERAGFVREGARRDAYWRRDRWLDGVMFGLLAEEFEP